jgi:hypothetical protein
VARLATFRWHSPPPTSVDEVLVIEDELAHLVIRRPKRTMSTVGSYLGRPEEADRSVLLAVGGGPVTFELWPPVSDPGPGALMAVADRVAESCLSQPRATVTFAAGVTGVDESGALDLALVATGAGSDPVTFELDPDASIVHLSGPGGEITWVPMPRPPTGLVTVDAMGIGGVGTAARLAPGTPVATTVRVPGVPGATTIAIEVAGWLSDGLPDEPLPERFLVRTPETPIPQ